MALAGAGETDERLVSEAADLLFHLYVLLAARDLDLGGRGGRARRRATERTATELREASG